MEDNVPGTTELLTCDSTRILARFKFICSEMLHYKDSLLAVRLNDESDTMFIQIAAKTIDTYVTKEALTVLNLNAESDW